MDFGLGYIGVGIAAGLAILGAGLVKYYAQNFLCFPKR